ncbi:DUF1102 domain-containing protein [Natrinema hispanicum]|nr:DUF1102 domain-containing protein [Natrinema hispanicum]
MQRRKFVIGMGALASGAAAGIGTGAFSSVSATRNVDVEVADDASAYLRLQGTGGNNSDYVTDDGDGGTLTIDLSSSNSGDVSGGGEGVNPDAVTKIDNLFTVENQGTQEVDVSISKSGDNKGLVEFYPNADYDGDSLSDSAETLGTGISTDVSIKIDTTDAGLSDETELLDSVTFNAVATN